MSRSEALWGLRRGAASAIPTLTRSVPVPVDGGKIQIAARSCFRLPGLLARVERVQVEQVRSR